MLDELVDFLGITYPSKNIESVSWLGAPAYTDKGRLALQEASKTGRTAPTAAIEKYGNDGESGSRARQRRRDTWDGDRRE